MFSDCGVFKHSIALPKISAGVALLGEDRSFGANPHCPGGLDERSETSQPGQRSKLAGKSLQGQNRKATTTMANGGSASNSGLPLDDALAPRTDLPRRVITRPTSS